MCLYSSIGVLRYSDDPLKLVVEVDREISFYYRAMLPKWVKTNPQRYAPHISVVRHEVPPRMDRWRAFDGEQVEFFYENVVRNGEVYIWLNAFCNRLEEVRSDLGLEVSSPYTMPPEGFQKCFHITIGNYK